MEKLTFVTEDQESVDFYIIEETRVNGINYLLVTESEDEEDEEAEAYILKDTSKAEYEKHSQRQKIQKRFMNLLNRKKNWMQSAAFLPSYWKTWI